MNRKALLSLLVVVLVASFVSACSSSKKAAPVISVQLAPPPPGSLEVSYMAQLGAQVVNDTAAAGVDWSLSCTSADCGSISPAHTASGGATTFTAPASVPTGVTVTVTATSTTDSTASQSSDVTITPVGSLGSLMDLGQYAFVVTGIDENGFYAAAGSITSDGNGNISGGIEDFSDPDFVTSPGGDPVTGTYNIGSDGRGSLTIIGDEVGTQLFSIAVTSSSHALIAEVDGVNTTSGTLDLQDNTSFAAGIPANTLVFAMQGWDLFDDGVAASGGAVVTTPSDAGDGSGAVTAGAFDLNDEGFFGSGDLSTVADLTYTALDGNGRGVLTSPADLFGDGNVYTVVVYMISPGVYRAIETDDLFVEGGSIYAGAAPASTLDDGTPVYDTTQITGPFAFLENGQESGFGPVGFAGQFTTDGAGTITGGFSDANEDGDVNSAAVTGVYGYPSDFAGSTLPRAVLEFDTGNGDGGDLEFYFAYIVDPSINILDPNNAIVGAGTLLFDANEFATGTGAAVEQSPATLQGNYAVGVQVDAETGDQEDIVGQGFSDGVSTITGNTDAGFLGGNALALPTTISFTADPDNPGRFTGTIFIGSSSPVDFVFYQASSTQLVSTGVDDFFVANGYLIHQ